jgi:hypothetical protein
MLMLAERAKWRKKIFNWSAVALVLAVIGLSIYGHTESNVDRELKAYIADLTPQQVSTELINADLKYFDSAEEIANLPAPRTVHILQKSEIYDDSFTMLKDYTIEVGGHVYQVKAANHVKHWQPIAEWRFFIHRIE